MTHRLSVRTPVLHNAPEEEQVVWQVIDSVAGNAPGGVVLQARPIHAEILGHIISQLGWGFDPKSVECGTDEVARGASVIVVVPRAGRVGVRRLSRGQCAAGGKRTEAKLLTVGNKQRKHR